MLDIENMLEEGKPGPDDSRILAAGEYIPCCTFATAPDLPEKLRSSLERLLLGLSKDATARVGSEILSVMGRADVDGFEKLEDRDYDFLRKMAKKVEMPPYQKYGSLNP